ncbi:MAG: tetratricopeptide repeat protein [Candidatus Aminicenantes bacterium]|nr:tetratricopeptide repeat protein [Candidatus Aminicenantes bacterium]
MGKIASQFIFIWIAVFFVNSYFFPSCPEQEDIAERADLMLDMMEYESAIMNYMRVLSQNPQQRHIRKEIGYAYYQLEKVDDALNSIKEELNLFPDNGDAYDLLTYILYKLDKLHEANNFLKSLDFPIILTEENPHIGGLACFILGMHFKQVKEYRRAEKFFRRAIEKGHDKVKCFVQLIDIELFQGRLKFDVEFAPIIKYTFSLDSILAEAVGEYQSRPEFLFIIGLRYFKDYLNISIQIDPLENLIKSVKSFELASELKPDFKDAIFNLACISYNFNDFRKASEYFQKVIEIDPEDAEVKFYLDCCQKKLDTSLDKKLISEQCPKWINLSREFIDKPDREYDYKYHNDIEFVFENINHLGLEYIKVGKFQEGLKRFRNGLKINPHSPGIHLNMGLVYSWLDDFKEAEKHTLLALREKDFIGRVPASRRREIQRKMKASIQKATAIPLSEWTFDVALKEGNYFLDAYNTLGTLYFDRKEFDKSILAFKKVIEIYQGDAMGHYNLGCACWAIDDKKNAEKEWKDAIRYEEEMKRMEKTGEVSEDQLDVSLIVLYRPIAFRAHKSLGRLYFERNLKDKALKEFERALKLEPEDPEPYYEIGKIYEEKSEHDEKYLRKAISSYEKYLYLGGEKEAEVKEILKSLK